MGEEEDSLSLPASNVSGNESAVLALGAAHTVVLHLSHAQTLPVYDGIAETDGQQNKGIQIYTK